MFVICTYNYVVKLIINFVLFPILKSCCSAHVLVDQYIL